MLLTLLAVIFSIGLTFASIELPDLLQGVLVERVPALEGDGHADDSALFRTELFMDYYHLHVIGYVCFGLMVLLIIGGFITGRKGLASAGGLLMFLPVFAQFAGVMFFLAGLGVLNLIWLPVLDISFNAGRLGEIVYLPYRLLRSLFSRLGVDIYYPLVYLLIGIGLLLFVLGTLAWFLARYKNKDVVDFWVYRFSRHPQYLGWIIWSYGMLLALMRVRYPKRSWGIVASLPWLLSAMIIIGVALMEERKMKRLVGEMKRTDDRRTKDLISMALADIGKPAVDPLIELLEESDPDLRRFSASALGKIGDYRAVDPLMELLDDEKINVRAAKLKGEEVHVRREIVVALLKIGSEKAEASLREALEDEDWEVRFYAEEALKKISRRDR